MALRVIWQYMDRFVTKKYYMDRSFMIIHIHFTNKDNYKVYENLVQHVNLQIVISLS